MGNMITATVKIAGSRPLFFHHFGPDAMPLEKQERGGKAGNDPEEWRKTVCVTKSGQLFMDSTYAFATIREGSRYTKKGRGSIQPAVIATLQVDTDRILVDRYWPGFPNGHDFDVMKAETPPLDSDAPVYIDVRRVVNPVSKGANVRYRVVCSKGWQCEFAIQWDKTIISRGEMEAAVRDAGKLSGIGNARKIGMGRFEVALFDVSE